MDVRGLPGQALALATRTAVGAYRAAVDVNMYRRTDGREILLNQPDGWEVDSPWLWWLGPDGGDGTGGPWGTPPPGAGGGPYTGTSLPAVTRATSLICDTLAGLPWQVRRNRWELVDQPTWLSDPAALRQDGRVHGPSLDEIRLSAVEFWSEWLTSALWYGDGFVYVPVRDSAGAPRPPMWHLHPDAVDLRDGRYWVTGMEETNDPDVELPAGSVIHLREGKIHDGRGTGVLRQHAADLGLALATRSYATNQYRSGIPAGYLKSSQPRLDEDDAIELRRKWNAQHAGRRQIAILNATTEFHPISVSPLDAQLDSARQWSLRDLALAFGLPAYMFGVPGDNATYANVESRMIELRMFTFLPRARRIESTLDAEFPRGTNLKIKTAGLERADTQTRYNAYKLALDAGWLDEDEVRDLEDLPPRGSEIPATAPGNPELPAGAPAGELTLVEGTP